ncbi:hypothetical protein LIX60_30665 [Streptomyces sp. S07_1.15]|uniref:hypothetical protein n=1 Tax=Streptomyces sp. S07_1.15 TaxID=2873925 RepID=UPI001D159D4D|nr:hypothetical protein [Streptomyces sp. S07_1.15]MCC3655745.1 hypothetical protein [Streptomyces sp. S07_1.15]
MNILLDSVPEIVGGLVVTGLAVVGGWLAKRRVARRNADAAVRRYTVLNLVDPTGQPFIHSTTYRAGSIVNLNLGTGQTERVRLTDALLPDGTYAAEAVDRY